MRPLRFDPALDIGLTAGGGALWITSEVLKSSLAPRACRWCGDEVPGIDAFGRRTFLWDDTQLAARFSDASAFVLAPATAIGLLLAEPDPKKREHFEVDLVLVVQAVVVAANVTQATKLVVTRERPFVAALLPEEKGATAQPSDNNLSFFSGHTSVAVSSVVSASTIAFMRGYGVAPWILGAGLPLALGAGYFRVAADRHYVTDVLVGAAVGGAAGALVPWVFHRPLGRDGALGEVRASVVPARGGASLTVFGTF